jgi:hypothetical protein
MMAVVPVQCPRCDGISVVKYDKPAKRWPRSLLERRSQWELRQSWTGLGGDFGFSLSKEDNHGHRTSFNRGPVPALPL